MASRPKDDFLFGRKAASTFTTVREVCEFCSLTGGVAEIPGPEQQRFSFTAASVIFPRLKLFSSASESIAIKTQFPASSFGIGLPLSGQGVLKTGARETSWTAGRSIIFDAGCSGSTYAATSYRSLSFAFVDVDHLKSIMTGMFQGETSKVVLPFAGVREMSVLENKFSSLIIASLGFIDSVDGGADHLARIGYEDVIIRLIGQMLYFAANGPRAEDGPRRDKRSSRAVDVVCDHILSSKDRLLTSSEMEKLTGLTRRALSYAFKERFNCTPQEWQRNHRLDLAHNHLNQDGVTDTVKVVARRFGFVSAQSFARFYRERFGHMPRGK